MSGVRAVGGAGGGMRTGGMLCRSQAATAVCVPGDARSMVVARRADRTIVAGGGGNDDARVLHDVRYARLGSGAGDGVARRSTSRRFRAAPPPPPPPTATAVTSASCRPRVERQQRRATARAAPVAVTLPMVTKSPSKEAPPKDLAAAAKRVQAAAVAAPGGDQLLQVRN